MYSYHTLLATGLAYFVFAFLAIRARKWYYPVFHPYAVFCFAMVWQFRHASDINDIAITADRALASGFVLSSLLFWAAYFIVSKLFFNGAPVVGPNRFEFTAPRFWFFIVALLVAIVGYHVFNYYRVGCFDDMFFERYNHALLDRLRNTAPPPLWFTGCFVLFMYVFNVSMPVSIALLFETLRKDRKIRGVLPVVTACFVTFAAMTAVFLTGFRTTAGQALIVMALLTVLSFVFPSRKLSKAAVPILLFFSLYAFVGLLVMEPLRTRGLRSFASTVSRVFTEQGVFAAVTSALRSDDSDRDREMQELIKRFQEKKKQFQGKDAVEAERQFLLTYWGSASSSRELAWTMMYYGRHKEFLGLDYPFRQFRLLPLPGRWIGRPKPCISELNALERGIPHTQLIPGQFGEGYAAAGYFGGYFLWGVYAFLGGLLSRFATSWVFVPNPRFETQALGIFLMLRIPFMMTTNTPYPEFYYGFAILFVAEYVVLRFLTRDFKNDKNRTCPKSP